MVTSNVDAVYDGHLGNHARFVSHDVVYFIFSISISFLVFVSHGVVYLNFWYFHFIFSICQS